MRIVRLVRDESGVVAVEFGLVLPFLMLIVFGIIDFSRAYYTLNDLTTSVREGARFAAVIEDPMSRERDIQDVVINMARTFGGETVTREQVRVEVAGGAVGQMVTVRIQGYEFTPITPIFALFGVRSFQVTRQATFRLERQPPTTPAAE
jgi:Flp pilus assembly protein TadG